MSFSERNQALNQTVVASDIPQDVIGLSPKAIYRSVAINPADKSTDQVNYSLGMWGKLIILGTIKRQGGKQQVDPEQHVHDLNWDTIFLEVFHRTHPKMQYLLSADSCLRWYENRIRIYKEYFPSYNAHESAIDQLIRHYSIQLMALNEASEFLGMNRERVYWENVHTLPISAGLRSDDQSAQHVSDLLKLSPSFSTIRDKFSIEFQPMNPGKAVVSEQSRGCHRSNVIASPIAGKKQTVENHGQAKCTNQTVEDDKINKKSKVVIKIDASRKKPECSLIDESSNEVMIYADHAVIEHNVHGNTPSNLDLLNFDPANVAPKNVALKNLAPKNFVSANVAPTASTNLSPRNVTSTNVAPVNLASATKRNKPEHDDLLSTNGVEVGKRSRTEDPEMVKPLLLSVLWKLKEGQGLLYDMSNLLENVTSLSGRKPCEYTLTRIEQKIRNDEITDVKTLINSCRCLVSLFIISQNNRIISKEAFQVLDSLRKGME